jgi:cob(I)alamin adenosyltransferase
MQRVHEGGPMSPPTIDTITPEQRVRIHERLQEAVALIGQAEDELAHEDEAKQELKDLAKSVWVIGYEILGDAKYVPVDELAAVIEQIDLTADAPASYFAQQILDRLHARGPDA